MGLHWKNWPSFYRSVVDSIEQKKKEKRRRERERVKNETNFALTVHLSDD